MENKVNIGEIFKTAKNFEIGAFFKSQNGTINLKLGEGVSLSSAGGDILVSVDGVSRKANGLFVNKVDDTIAFLGGLEGTTDSIERLKKRQAAGVTSLLKVKLGE